MLTTAAVRERSRRKNTIADTETAVNTSVDSAWSVTKLSPEELQNIHVTTSQNIISSKEETTSHVTLVVHAC